jgi:hypothetical protein
MSIIGPANDESSAGFERAITPRETATRVFAQTLQRNQRHVPSQHTSCGNSSNTSQRPRAALVAPMWRVLGNSRQLKRLDTTECYTILDCSLNEVFIDTERNCRQKRQQTLLPTALGTLHNKHTKIVCYPGCCTVLAAMHMPTPASRCC